ncbi:MAG: hypothetical protein ACP6IU_11125 [Candidatus Asgardarchaeia archaeon]
MTPKKKKDPLEIIDNITDALYDTKSVVRMHLKQAERDIAKAFKKGETPSPILLSRWKRLVMMRRAVDGTIELTNYARMSLEIREKLREAFEVFNTKEMREVMAVLQGTMDDLNTQFSSLLNLQRIFLRITQSGNIALTTRLNELDSFVEEIQEEAMSQFGQELIEMMRVESPELYEMMPEDVKKMVSQEKKKSEKLQVS